MASQAIATRPVTHTVDTIGLSKATASKALEPQALKDLTTSVRESKAGADRAAGEVMWDASILFYNAVEVSDAIGAEKMYASQGDYAGALGFSKAYGSRLIRLGRAIVRHDVRKGSAAWSFLAANASSAVFAPVLGKDAVSTEDFRAVLDKAMADMKSTGKIDTGKREAQPDEGDKASSKGEADKAPAKAPATYRDLLAIIPEFEVVLHSLDDEGAEKVHAAFLKVVAGDKARRRVLADKAAADKATADKAAAPKPAAPKAKAPKVEAPKVEAPAETPAA